MINKKAAEIVKKAENEGLTHREIARICGIKPPFSTSILSVSFRVRQYSFIERSKSYLTYSFNFIDFGMR